MEIAFLGINDVGWDIYEWLCNRDSVTVQALITTEQQLSLIEELSVDAAVAVGYQHIVSEEMLEYPDSGCINVHPGYLPDARGFNPNVWSIIEDLPAGVTIHYMDSSIDTGEIIARQEVHRSAADTGESLYNRIERACVELFKETWPDIESGEVETKQQSEEQAHFHYKSDFEELCHIDRNQTYEAGELIDILRALTFPPFNNAFFEVDGEKYYMDIDITCASELDDVDRVGLLSSY